MSKISLGKSIEHKVVSEMLLEGYEVFLPVADDDGVDLVAKTLNGNIVEVQVKASFKTSQCGLFSAISHNPRANFYFVFFVVQLNKTWIIPSADFVKLASCNTKGKNKGKYSIDILKHSCSKYCVTCYSGSII